MRSQNDDIKSHKDIQTYAIIGAAIEVHKVLGNGFLESVYQDALEIEFKERKIPYEREAQILVSYKNEPLNTHYRSDFVCFGSIIVELKAMKEIGSIEEAQILHYLRATGYQRGLLINFGSQSLQYKRLVHNYTG